MTEGRWGCSARGVAGRPAPADARSGPAGSISTDSVRSSATRDETVVLDRPVSRAISTRLIAPRSRTALITDDRFRWRKEGNEPPALAAENVALRPSRPLLVPIGAPYQAAAVLVRNASE